MFSKIDTHNGSLIHKKIMAIVVTLMMLGFLMPAHVFVLASSNSSDYLCGHVHDESCGYTEAGSSETCNHTCNILSFEDYTPGKALDTFTAKAGQTYEEICAELPESLTGKLDCTDGNIEIPVKWTCKTFTGEAGKYSFHAKLTNKHCSYTVEDELPFIAVTVPKAEGTSSKNSQKISCEINTISDDTNTVTVTGLMPKDARLVVKNVSLSKAQALLDEVGTVALFAYDIKIMTGGKLDEVTGEYVGEAEYQPSEDNPVTVTITPHDGIDAPSVEVVHIAKDAKTGAKTPQNVSNVTSTDKAVEFEANGFSVYVVTMGTNTPRVSFSYDDSNFDVKYCTTIDGTYSTLGDNVSVDIGTSLYFMIEGGNNVNVYRDGSTTLAADNNGIYTIENITSNTNITIGTIVQLDISYGNIRIGDDGSGGRTYIYSDSTGPKSGVHVSSNIYEISGTTGTPNGGGEYNVSMIGEGDFNVILKNVSIYTGKLNDQSAPLSDLGNCAPISTNGVTGTGNINITLVGDNTLKNISRNSQNSYAALEKNGNSSTLIINGTGTLIATGGADSAGIGSSDLVSTTPGTKNITINGGNITATTVDSQGAGIGSGNNKEAESIKIYGGTITSIGVCNGAGIGGSGSKSFTATLGEVYIYGGNITAISNGSGACIGGGGSGDNGGSIGGNGRVYIYGGSIKTTSNGTGAGIGGGSAYNGGTATVDISGGTIVTSRISGGFSEKSEIKAFEDATLSIAAASVNISDSSNINSITGPDPNNLGMPTVVFCQTIDVDNLEGFSGGSGYVTIQSAGLDDGVTYSLKDVYADENGKVYFWLPTEYNVTSLTINGTSYNVVDSAQTQAATITHDSSTVGTVLGAVLNFGTANCYQWQISIDGTDWTNINGATSERYTVVSDNAKKYIRVVITSNGGPIISEKLYITKEPFASIQYDSLRAPSELTAQLLNGSGGTYNYQWQESNDGTSWTNISVATAATFTTEISLIGKRIRVIITDGAITYTTSFVGILAPQLDITAPLSMEISVNGAGECTVTSSSNQIINETSVPVCVTDIAYDWITDGESDANEIFYNYENAEATLTLDEAPNEKTYSFGGSEPEIIQPNIQIAAKSGDTPGTLPLQWAFNLGSGNYINLAPAVNGTKVATITYTVDYKLTP